MLAFVAGLVLALVAGFSLARMVEEPASPPAGRPAAPGDGGANPAAHDHGAGGVPSVSTQVGGLAVSAGGYTLVPESRSLSAGARTRWRFHIEGPDRRPATDFAIVHEKPLHLFVAGRDMSGYQHLHPTMAADGTWSVDLLLPRAGVWRAFADFAAVDPAGTQVATTLAVDLTVPGDYRPRALPAVARESIVDGLTVTLEGTPQVGATRPLLFRVFRDGSPVTDLTRYLGSYGHLVVLRDGDLGYVHAHAEEQVGPTPRAGGAVKFWLAAPTPGRFRLFFDFQVGGQVRTAEFTVVAR
ncbi:hypothetical protein [Phytohabitans suffuscus]|uniref:hypothetical protein n=1 Tax=Phytohabitans suffuscus TaxID=624315 RepID=UPI001E494118|nr:hypothetical protein [Phytohabitans suffuscus]